MRRSAIAIVEAKKPSGCVVKLEDRKARVRRTQSREGSPERSRSKSRDEEGAWSKSPSRGQNDATARMLQEKPPPEATVPTDKAKPKFAASPTKR